MHQPRQNPARVRQTDPALADDATQAPTLGPRTVPYCHVAIVIQFAEDAGLDADPWLRRLGFDRTRFEELDARAPADQYTKLVLEIGSVRSDSSFWLGLGQQFTFPAIGEMGLLLQACASARDALPRLCKFYDILSCGTSLDMQWHTNGDASVVLRQNCPAHTVESRLKYELLLGGLARNAELLGGRTEPPPRYELAYLQPPDLAPYQRVLGPHVSFGHERCRMTVAAARLDEPYPLANRTMRALLSKRCDSALRRAVVRPSIDELVRRSIVHTQGLAPTLAQVASKLGLSDRTLSRKLRERGLKFEELRGELQYERAREMLGDATLSVAEVAQHVGFDSASSFARAFVRWSGSTPTAFRRGSTTDGAKQRSRRPQGP